MPVHDHPSVNAVRATTEPESTSLPLPLPCPPCPQMPPCCAPAYQQQVASAFEPLPVPQPANETLLPRQNPALGGAATRPPFRPDKQADRVVARAAASLRARQQATLSIATSISGREGSGGLRTTAEQQLQPGSSRLVRGLSVFKDSFGAGVNWLWNAPNPGRHACITLLAHQSMPGAATASRCPPPVCPCIRVGCRAASSAACDCTTPVRHSCLCLSCHVQMTCFRTTGTMTATKVGSTAPGQREPLQRLVPRCRSSRLGNRRGCRPSRPWARRRAVAAAAAGLTWLDMRIAPAEHDSDSVQAVQKRSGM